MNPQDRIDYIVSMYQMLNPNIEITKDSTIRGTPIWKLCEFAGPGYFRVQGWLEKKVQEIPRKDPQEIVEDDMAKAKKVFDECYELMVGRNKAYGSSWKVMSPKSLANLIEMKMNRVSQLPEGNPKTIDEFSDCLNYCVFALIGLTNKK